MTEPINPKRIPILLRERPQWVMWRYEERDGKKTKPPFTVSGRAASHSDPETWTSFEAAWTAYEKGGWAGIGFVLSGENHLIGVDMDHCLSDEGEVEEWAAAIVDRLDSYTEVTPSGRGLRVFVEGELPEWAAESGNKKAWTSNGKDFGLEFYRTKRFLTVTGKRLKGVPDTIQRRNGELTDLYQEWFKPKPKRVTVTTDRSATSLPSDHELLAAMFRAQNGPQIIALWNGDTSAHSSDDSAADLALCNHLAWWTRGDEAAMDRLFRMSRLYRDKWDREDYRLNTLGLALESLKAGEGYEPAGSTFAVEGTGETQGQPTQERVAAAIRIAEELPQRLKKDAGAAFAPDMLQALAVLSQHDPQAYERVRITYSKTRGASVRRLDKEVGKITRGKADYKAPRVVGESLPGAPWPSLLVPSRYYLDAEATGEVTTDEDGNAHRKPFAFAPILVTERYRDMDAGTEALQLSFFREQQGWVSTVADRATALDSKKALELANLGFPIASDNSSDVAKYIHTFEATNFHLLRQARISSHLGWQGKKGADGFLWGRSLLTADGEQTQPLHLDEIAPDAWQQHWIAFRGSGAGDDQIADGFHASGDWQRYLEVIRPIRDYPRVLLAFYAAFTPILLDLLNAPNPIIDWSNRTSTGKSITLRVAASVHGKPDERATDGAMATWDSTQVWIERASSVLHNLPVILDDTARARDKKAISGLVYLVSSGRGRGRGTVKGLARTRTWRTALLSNGEQPITEYGNEGGTRARVMSIKGAPFHEESEVSRRVVNDLNIGLPLHYGHAGPRFVRWVMAHLSEAPFWIAEYHRCADLYAEKSKGGVEGRLAQVAAVIDLTAALVHEAFPDLGWPYHDPLEGLWDEILRDAADAPPEIRALRDAMDWAHQHRGAFWDHLRNAGSPRDQEPVGTGWLGIWDVGTGLDNHQWSEILFAPLHLRQKLREWGYEPRAVIGAWLQRGWLRTSGEKGVDTAKVTFDGAHPRFVVVLREAVEEVDRVPEDE